MLKETEVAQIKQSIEEKCPQSKILYSIVNTRIKTKFTTSNGMNP